LLLLLSAWAYFFHKTSSFNKIQYMVKYDIILGKNEIHKSHFRATPPRGLTKNLSFRLGFKINLPAKADDAKNEPL
jgi:hypothetical protein